METSEASGNINDQTKIYRIFNFYDLINTISGNQLRLSQVSRMEDPNELFGIYFGLLSSEFGPFFKEGIPTLVNSFTEAQSCHYLNCWTLVKDNIAVWSLYSKSREGILVGTTFGKLKAAVWEHCEEYSFARCYQLEPNDPTDLFMPPSIGQVDYVDFEKLYNELRQKRETYHKILGERAANMEENGSAERKGALISDILDEVFGDRKKYPDGPLLKDHRYQHEKEIRVCLRLTRRDGRTRTEYEAYTFAGLDDPSRSPPPELCPSNIYVPIPGDFIESVEADGRLENWKFDAYRTILKKFSLDLGLNDAFGRLSV